MLKKKKIPFSFLIHTHSFKAPCQNHWMFPCETRVLADYENTLQVQWEEMFVAIGTLCEKEVEINPSPQTEPYGAELDSK